MIARKIDTQPINEPPVQFYKTIAISFLIITIILLGVVVFITVKKATIEITAKEDSKQVSLTLGVGENADMTGTVTSTLYEWSNKYYPTGVKMIEDKAEGKIVVYNKQSKDQPLIKNTRFLSSDGVLFRMKVRDTIPANGQKEVEVYADVVGSTGDIMPAQFTIPGLSQSLQTLVYGESVEAMVGGFRKVGALSVDDLDSANMLYKEQVKEAFLKGLGLNSLGVALKIDIGKIKADKEIGEEVSEFTLTGLNRVVVVNYDPKVLQEIINSKVASEIDKGAEKFLAVNNEPRVELVTINEETGLAEFSVYQEVLVTLDANADRLAIVNFAGKKKDEIERYVLALDHVIGVDVKFSPGWMRTAPSVSDKIKVLVKSVR